MTEKLKETVEKILKDEKSAKEFMELKTLKEVYEKCKEFGYQSDYEEFEKDYNKIVSGLSEKLSLEELEAVSGGKMNKKLSKTTAAILSALTLSTAAVPQSSASWYYNKNSKSDASNDTTQPVQSDDYDKTASSTSEGTDYFVPDLSFEQAKQRFGNADDAICYFMLVENFEKHLKLEQREKFLNATKIDDMLNILDIKQLKYLKSSFDMNNVAYGCMRQKLYHFIYSYESDENKLQTTYGPYMFPTWLKERLNQYCDEVKINFKPEPKSISKFEVTLQLCGYKFEKLESLCSKKIFEKIDNILESKDTNSEQDLSIVEQRKLIGKYSKPAVDGGIYNRLLRERIFANESRSEKFNEDIEKFKERYRRHENIDEFVDQIKKIRKYFSEHRTTRDYTVYRGSKLVELFALLKNSNPTIDIPKSDYDEFLENIRTIMEQINKEQPVVFDYGFTSTSLSEGIASSINFKGKWPGYLFFKIHIPKGSKALILDYEGIENVPFEEEVLLAEQTKLKIKSMKKIDGHYEIEADVVNEN